MAHQPVHDIQLIGPSEAIGLASSDCSSNTDSCDLTDYLVATTDGDRTWRTI